MKPPSENSEPDEQSAGANSGLPDSGATTAGGETPSTHFESASFQSRDPSCDVVACVIRDARGRLLVGRRPLNKRHGGLWEFPGGKVRAGESLAEAAARELGEELGLEAIRVASGVLFERMDPGSDFRILFVRVDTREAPRALEHGALEWLDVTEVRDDLHLAPADAAFVRALRDGAVTLLPGLAGPLEGSGAP